MLQAIGLSYEPSPIVGPLFQNLDVSLGACETVVLMGNNGAGKTKLLEILAGITIPARGHVIRVPKCRVGYLPQDVDVDFRGTLADYLFSGTEGLTSGLLARACARMGLESTLLERDYSRLSVGERIRATLGRIMLDEPTVLLLDEPTNHLDAAGRRWLIDFLDSSRTACLMVSHDRAVINSIADRVLLLADGRLQEFKGGYDEMTQALALAREAQRERYDAQRQEAERLRRASEQMSVRAARITKKKKGKELDGAAKPFYAAVEARMQARAKAVRTRLSQSMQVRVEKPYEEDAVAISFNTRPLRHSDALAVRGLSKSFGTHSLFDDLAMTAGKGDRIAVLGGNGAGKTTLLKILAGEIEPDRGEVNWAPEAIPTFLSQERTRLDLDLPVIEALNHPGPDQDRFVRTLLARLRIRGEAADKPMRALSVGERTKAELVSVLMTEANVLLLDEPTNHLDIDSLEALESALRDFKGAILFTSHDAAFVERLATEVIHLG